MEITACGDKVDPAGHQLPRCWDKAAHVTTASVDPLYPGARMAGVFVGRCQRNDLQQKKLKDSMPPDMSANFDQPRTTALQFYTTFKDESC